jgi:transcriptional regulator with XRE-family HTH domain
MVAEAGRDQLIEIGEVVARSVKWVRESARITQQQLADDMGRLGFVNWKRITVAEVESGKRRLSVEEMIGIAVLFDVPVAYLMAGFRGDEVVALNERLLLTPSQAQELITGEPVESGWLWGLRLKATAAGRAIATQFGIPGEDDWRPCSEYGEIWANAEDGEAFGIAHLPDPATR